MARSSIRSRTGLGRNVADPAGAPGAEFSLGVPPTPDVDRIPARSGPDMFDLQNFTLGDRSALGSALRQRGRDTETDRRFRQMEKLLSKPAKSAPEAETLERLGGRMGFQRDAAAGTTFHFGLPEWRTESEPGGDRSADPRVRHPVPHGGAGDGAPGAAGRLIPLLVRSRDARRRSRASAATNPPTPLRRTPHAVGCGASAQPSRPLRSRSCRNGPRRDRS